MMVFFTAKCQRNNWSANKTLEIQYLATGEATNWNNHDLQHLLFLSAVGVLASLFTLSMAPQSKS